MYLYKIWMRKGSQIMIMILKTEKNSNVLNI